MGNDAGADLASVSRNFPAKHNFYNERLAKIHRDVAASDALAQEPLPVDDPTRRRPDITRAQESLGWAPKISFEQGLAETIAWFRDNP